MDKDGIVLLKKVRGLSVGVGWTPFFSGLNFLQVFAVYSNGFYFSHVGSFRDTNRYKIFFEIVIVPFLLVKSPIC